MLLIVLHNGILFLNNFILTVWKGIWHNLD